MKNLVLPFVWIASCLLYTVGINAQTIITIDNTANSTTTYQTIQDAIDAASAGDIIHVQPSPLNYGAAVIDKPLTIIGRSHSETNKISTLTNIIYESSDITIKGIDFTDLRAPFRNFGDPNFAYSNINIEDCNIESITIGTSAVNTLSDVTITGSYISRKLINRRGSTNTTVTNNIFTSTFPLEIFDADEIVISNNIFRNNSGVTIRNVDLDGLPINMFNNMFIVNNTGGGDVNFTFDTTFSSGGYNLSNNLYYNYTAAGINILGNATRNQTNELIDVVPLFTSVDPTVSGSIAGPSSFFASTAFNDDLTLQAVSPAINGGVGGSQIGIYGNGFNFELQGRPRGVPILDILRFDGTVPKNGVINATIKAKGF
ncbi:MAG: hypothetical protein WBA16_06040 [Nonlabens sp.]